MRTVKTKEIPAITGQLKPCQNYSEIIPSTVPGNHDIREPQKTAIIGTVDILWKVKQGKR